MVEPRPEILVDVENAVQSQAVDCAEDYQNYMATVVKCYDTYLNN